MVKPKEMGVESPEENKIHDAVARERRGSRLQGFLLYARMDGRMEKEKESFRFFRISISSDFGMEMSL